MENVSGLGSYGLWRSSSSPQHVPLTLCRKATKRQNVRNETVETVETEKLFFCVNKCHVFFRSISSFFFDLCDTFVRYQWLSSERFAELFAMANCLPGPSSTQACGANPSKCGLESRVVVNDALIRHAAISFSQHFLSQFLQVAFAIGITQGGGHRLEHTHMAAFPVTCEAE